MSKNGYLAKKQKEKVTREAYAETFKEIYLDIACKVALVTMNQVFGIGRERAVRFWKAFEDNTEEFSRWAVEGDYEYAIDRLNKAVEQTLGNEVLSVKLKV